MERVYICWRSAFSPGAWLQNCFKIFRSLYKWIRPQAVNPIRCFHSQDFLYRNKNGSFTMAKQLFFGLFPALLFTMWTGRADAQALTVKQAVQNALNNYGTIKAKADYVKSAKANVRETKNEYLPDIQFSLSQDYGTVASNFGPYAAYKTSP